MGIDLIGPLPLTENGNRYIVTLVDFFSKWPEAETLPNKGAKSVSLFFVQDDVQVCVLCSVSFIPVLRKMHITVTGGISSYCLSTNIALA